MCGSWQAVLKMALNFVTATIWQWSGELASRPVGCHKTKHNPAYGRVKTRRKQSMRLNRQRQAGGQVSEDEICCRKSSLKNKDFQTRLLHADCSTECLFLGYWALLVNVTHFHFHPGPPKKEIRIFMNQCFRLIQDQLSLEFLSNTQLTLWCCPYPLFVYKRETAALLYFILSVFVITKG